MDNISNLISAMGITMGVCIGLPMVYVVAIVLKKKFSLVPTLAGFVGYMVFGTLLVNAVVGSLTGKIGSGYTAAVIGSVLMGIIEAAGMFMIMRLIENRYEGTKLPLSFGWGYTLISTWFVGGAQIFNPLSVAMAVRDRGADYLLDTIDEALRPELELQINQVLSLSFSDYLLGGLEIVCFFGISIAMAIIIYYAVRGDMKYLGIGAGLHMLDRLPLKLYDYEKISMTPAMVIYITVTLASVGFAIWTYRKKEGPAPVPMASPLKARLR